MKTLKEYADHVSFQKTGYGTWKVIVSYRDHYCTGITHDSMAIDRIGCDLPARAREYGYTEKEAYEALYNSINFDRKYIGKYR
jgi:hypothetical protein